eukprot:TRINITY_DN346_c0_g1_i1.p1 TRINITY_DN346_c0_g1~~TRINITY_DN346_c0_g1_i1.p1  ORF type:complete len:534 (+),score=105.32 TRINITY_DN346_c0_g1_i1:37-1638(+)
MTIRYLLVALFFVTLACADVPVHCPSIVSGTWRISLGAAGWLKDIDCTSFTVTDILTVYLQLPNLVYADAGHTQQIGLYTMVADEGIEIQVKNRDYFAFFYYGKNSSCEYTANGWVHDTEVSRNWGCFVAHRMPSTLESLPQLTSVVQTSPFQMHRGRPPFGHGHGHGGLPHPPRDLPSVPQLAFPKDKAFGRVGQFIAPWMVEMAKPYDLGASVCAHINQANPGWTCDPFSDHWSRYSLASLRHAMAVHRPSKRHLQLLTLHHESDKSLADLLNPPTLPSAAPLTEQQKQMIASLPTEFDWRNVDGVNYVSPVRDQEFCGSCFSFSACGTMESRIRVASKNKFQPILSPEDIVSCDTNYAQGCNGGFAYLGGKYMKDFGIREESCFPYKAGSGTPSPCSERCVNGTSWKASDYGYIGGYLGAGNEANMMQEIYEHGPISVSVLMGADLLHYKSGIYTPVDLPAELTDKIGWEKTNHAVGIVGWGVDAAKAQKYWIVRNSWGSSWGEQGYFKVIRGTDAQHIESAGVFITCNL